MKKFNTEKVLYLASGDRPLHVSPKEYEMRSDLAEHVTRLTQAGRLVRVGSDDAGEYYAITDRGRVRLLELQIEWRKRNGKDTAEHEAKLKGVLAEGRES